MDVSGPAKRSVLDQPTLVLNRSWMPVHVTAVRRAIGMVFRGVALVVDSETLSIHNYPDWASRPVGGRVIRTCRAPVGAPEVVQLLNYDRVPIYQSPFTRQRLLRRDEFRCQYCGIQPPQSQLTIDHVVPRARGGRTSWENCVAACTRCNSHKGDRDFHHAGLRLQRQPRAPRWIPHLNLLPSEWNEAWSRFVPPGLRDRATGS